MTAPPPTTAIKNYIATVFKWAWMLQRFSITVLLALFLLVFYQCKKNPPPVPPVATPPACMTVSETNIYTGQADTLINCSDSTTSFSWSFGDGAGDNTDRTAVHAYQLPGVDTAKLYIWNKGSDTTMALKVVNVNFPPAYYTGTYTGSETCNLAGSDSQGFTVTGNGFGNLIFSDLYHTGKSFNATYTGNNGTIPPQTFSGDSLLWGTFTLAGDTISLSVIVTAFSFRDNCSGVYIRN